MLKKITEKQCHKSKRTDLEIEKIDSCDTSK